MESLITRNPVEPLKAQQFPGWTSGCRQVTRLKDLVFRGERVPGMNTCSYLDHGARRLGEIPQRKPEQAEQRRLRLEGLRAARGQDAATCRTAHASGTRGVSHTSNAQQGGGVLTSRLQSKVSQAGSVQREEAQGTGHYVLDVLQEKTHEY